jgi:hypothetical protein
VISKWKHTTTTQIHKYNEEEKVTLCAIGFAFLYTHGCHLFSLLRPAQVTNISTIDSEWMKQRHAYQYTSCSFFCTYRCKFSMVTISARNRSYLFPVCAHVASMIHSEDSVERRRSDDIQSACNTSRYCDWRNALLQSRHSQHITHTSEREGMRRVTETYTHTLD